MTSFLKTAALALALGTAAVPAAAQQLSPPVIVIVDMERRIELIRDRGGLLFVGSTAALARALELEGGAA